MVQDSQHEGWLITQMVRGTYCPIDAQLSNKIIYELIKYVFLVKFLNVLLKFVIKVKF